MSHTNRRQYQNQRAAENRAYIASLKEIPCDDCGGRFPSCVMDFDHVRGKKYNDIARMMLYKTETILAEIAKCDIICANCHRIRTYGK